ESDTTGVVLLQDSADIRPAFYRTHLPGPLARASLARHFGPLAEPGMPELTDIVLPPDQSEGTTHEIGQWLKQVGDAVALNEPLLEVITDKVTVELAAPAAGVLA